MDDVDPCNSFRPRSEQWDVDYVSPSPSTAYAIIYWDLESTVAHVFYR